MMVPSCRVCPAWRPARANAREMGTRAWPSVSDAVALLRQQHVAARMIEPLLAVRPFGLDLYGFGADLLTAHGADLAGAEPRPRSLRGPPRQLARRDLVADETSDLFVVHRIIDHSNTHAGPAGHPLHGGHVAARDGRRFGREQSLPSP